jgi:hypothetical protein
MLETTRIADEAKKIGQQAQEGAERAGREFQKAAEGGFEAASRSFSEANKGFQALAAEMMNYSKEAFDDAVRARSLSRASFYSVEMNVCRITY